MPFNQKFTVFLSNGTGDTRFNPIFMQQTQPKDNIFSTQVNTVQASDLETRAETDHFSLKKVSDAQLFGARKRAFYRLNERFVSNITGDILCFTRSERRIVT